MTMVEERTKGQQLDDAERALVDAEQQHGRENPQLREPLEQVGALYSRDGLCSKAELVYKRLADILAKQSEQAAAIDALGKLAATYRMQSKWDDAEAIYLKALSVLGEGPDTKRRTAEHLCFLSGVYCQKRDWSQAENSLKKACQLFDEVFAGHNNYSRMCQLALAALSAQQGKNGEADEYLAKSQQPGTEGDDAATNQRALIELAQLYFKEGRFVEVDMLLAQTIYTDEHRLWPMHPRVGQDLHDRGELFLAQGCHADAEKAFKRAMEVRIESLGQAHPELARTAMSMAAMYIAQGRFADAEPVLKQAMKTRVLVFGVQHPGVAAAIETYVSVLKNTKRQSLAIMLEARARDIRTELVRHSERASATGRPPAS